MDQHLSLCLPALEDHKYNQERQGVIVLFFVCELYPAYGVYAVGTIGFNVAGTARMACSSSHSVKRFVITGDTGFPTVINQSINQPTNRSIDRSVNQSIKIFISDNTYSQHIMALCDLIKYHEYIYNAMPTYRSRN